MADETSTYEDQFDWDNAVSGGLLDKYVGTITHAEFGIDPDYNPETIRAMFDIELVSHDDPDIDLGPGDVMHEAFNVGNDSTWEVLDGGKRVAKIDGKKPRFNNNSGYGLVVASVLPGSKKRMEGADELMKVLRERGAATNAKIWEGLTFQWERIEKSFTPKGETEEVTYSTTLPTAFLGEGEVSAPAAPAADTSGDTNGKIEVTRDDLIAIAAKHDTYSKFLADAMSTYPGVEDGPLAADLMDEGKIYAEAHS